MPKVNGYTASARVASNVLVVLASLVIRETLMYQSKQPKAPTVYPNKSGVIGQFVEQMSSFGCDQGPVS